MATFRSRQQRDTVYDFLPPEPKAQRNDAQRRLRNLDVTDADFVVLRGEPGSRKASTLNDNAPLKRRRKAVMARTAWLPQVSVFLAKAEMRLRGLSERSFSAMVAMAAVMVFALAGGLAGIAGASAPTTTVANPLDISHVTLTREESGGMAVLVVRGVVENRSKGTVAVPDIRADLMAGETMVASTIIAPPASSMFSGHSRGFAARLPHPGGKDPQIKLSFTTPAVARP